jgi:tetratricopeptide (TPR) repeat protein
MRSYLLGLLNARLGEGEAAIEQAQHLETLGPPSDSIDLLPDLALEIRAMVAVEDGRLEDALALLETQTMRGSRDENPIGMEAVRPFGRLLRADALFELGRGEEALGWYGGFPHLLGTSPIVEGAHLSHIYGRMGQIYDQIGDTESAIDYYTRFVTRWEDADPQFEPRVDSARVRLQELQ